MSITKAANPGHPLYRGVSGSVAPPNELKKKRCRRADKDQVCSTTHGMLTQLRRESCYSECPYNACRICTLKMCALGSSHVTFNSCAIEYETQTPHIL